MSELISANLRIKLNNHSVCVNTCVFPSLLITVREPPVLCPFTSDEKDDVEIPVPPDDGLSSPKRAFKSGTTWKKYLKIELIFHDQIPKLCNNKERKLN